MQLNTKYKSATALELVYFKLYPMVNRILCDGSVICALSLTMFP